MDVEEINKLQEQLADLKEQLFICQQDETRYRNESIAFKNFVQNLYESCEAMEDSELGLEEVLENLKVNIRKFSKEYGIRL